nr:MAG TPA: hypothetical protein [Caudoviricetes sp.]
MAVVAVNKDGTEVIGDSLVRCRFDKHDWLDPITDHNRLTKEDMSFWVDLYDDSDGYYVNTSVELPKGSIKKLTGKELTWNDEPIELV